MKIRFNETYTSGFLGRNELHAGGLFFSIVYVNCITFTEDGTVSLSKRLIDAFRPMDLQDVHSIENYKAEGRYFQNEREYLVCRFDNISLEFTGLPTSVDSNILSFVVYDERRKLSWSEIYKVD